MPFFALNKKFQNKFRKNHANFSTKMSGQQLDPSPHSSIRDLQWGAFYLFIATQIIGGAKELVVPL